MGKNDALRIDGYGWGDFEEEVAVPSPAPVVAAEPIAPSQEQTFFEDRTPKPQDFGRPKKAIQEEASNGWNVEEPASIKQSTKEKSISPVRNARSVSKESPKKADKPKPSAPKDKPFDLGFELPSSTSQIAMSSRRPEPSRDDRQARDRRDSSSRSEKSWGRDESRGRSQGGSESGRGDARNRPSDASEQFDEQLGRTVRVREIPSGTGAGYVKTGEERAPFTRAQPREDPASRTYHRKESGATQMNDLDLGWGSESGSDDDVHHHGPVVKNFPVEAESAPMKTLTEKVASASIEPSPAKTSTPPKAADFDARLMDARFGGDPRNAASASGISTPQWQPQPPASFPQKTTPARVEERQNMHEEDLGWGAVEEPRKEEKKALSQSQRSQSPPKKQQERADDSGWGNAAQVQQAEPPKATQTHRAVPPSNYQAAQWQEGRSNSSGSIRIEDPNGTPVNIQELAGKAASTNGRDFEPQPSHPQIVSASPYMVGYGRGPNGTLDPVSAGQQAWVTCPYCHCGFGYPPLPVTGVPAAFINPFASSSPSNMYRQ